MGGGWWNREGGWGGEYGRGVGDGHGPDPDPDRNRDKARTNDHDHDRGRVHGYDHDRCYGDNGGPGTDTDAMNMRMQTGSQTVIHTQRGVWMGRAMWMGDRWNDNDNGAQLVSHWRRLDDRHRGKYATGRCERRRRRQRWR